MVLDSERKKRKKHTHIHILFSVLSANIALGVLFPCRSLGKSVTFLVVANLFTLPSSLLFLRRLHENTHFFPLFLFRVPRRDINAILVQCSVYPCHILWIHFLTFLNVEQNRDRPFFAIIITKFIVLEKPFIFMSFAEFLSSASFWVNDTKCSNPDIGRPQVSAPFKAPRGWMLWICLSRWVPRRANQQWQL